MSTGIKGDKEFINPVEVNTGADCPETLAGAATAAHCQPIEIAKAIGERTDAFCTVGYNEEGAKAFAKNLNFLRNLPFTRFGNVEEACGRLVDGLSNDGTCFELVTDDPNHPHHNAFMHLFADIVKQCNPDALSENTFRTFSAKNSSDEEIG